MALLRVTRLFVVVLATSTAVAFASVPVHAEPRAAAPASGMTATPLSAVGASAEAAADYASIVLADHPAVYYRLGDQGRTVADSSGHGVTGTYPEATATGVAGAISADSDDAVRASTSGTVLEAPVASLPTGDAARTMEFWFKAAGSSDITPVHTRRQIRMPAGPGLSGFVPLITPAGIVPATARRTRAAALRYRSPAPRIICGKFGCSGGREAWLGADWRQVVAMGSRNTCSTSARALLSSR